MQIIADNPDLVNNYINALDCIYFNTLNIYLTTPITTGKRYINWHTTQSKNFIKNSKEWQDSFSKDVLLPNKNSAFKARANIIKNKTLKSKLKYFNVINPARISNVNFTQNDYLYLCNNLLIEKTHYVILNKGWEFSGGCIYEFMISQIENIKCFDLKINPMDIDLGVSMIEKAKINSKDLWSNFQEKVLTEIKDLCVKF